MSQNKDIAFVTYACVNILQIQTPVVVEYRNTLPRDKRLKGCAAYCWNSSKKGIISKFRLILVIPNMLSSKYDSATVIAHEMIHAKMIENNTFDPEHHHDKKFQQIAKTMQSCLADIGIKVGEIYTPETDTE